MPITIDGNGTISGISAGGLPDNSVTSADIADAAVTPTKLSQPLTLATSQASTSGTFIDFTGIPSWVRRITVMFNGVSTNGTSNLRLQIGAGSVQTSGYISTAGVINTTTPGVASDTAGFSLAGAASAASITSGAVRLTTLGSNIWVIDGTVKNSTVSVTYVGGDVTLSGTLDRVRITTVNGTDTFDAGSINIMYE